MSVATGILGFGLAGRLFHGRIAQAAGLDIKAFATSKAEQVRAEFPGAAVDASVEALIERSDIDLVIVATPDHLHGVHARMALVAGKHVIVDKPLAPSAREAVELDALAKVKGLIYGVFHNRRWDNDYLTTKKLIDEGALGEVVHYQARWDRFRPVAKGGWRDRDMQGELFGLGPHMADQALALFGAPDWIMADVYNQRGFSQYNDGFDILMGKGRLRIALGVNYLSADTYVGRRVRGLKASFVKQQLDPQELQLIGGRTPDDPQFGREPESAYGQLIDGESGEARVVVSERGDWPAFYRAVAQAIREGGPAPVSPLDGARAVAVLEAAVESSKLGKRLDLPAFFAERGL